MSRVWNEESERRQEAFDQLVDNATHEVNNLIPDKALARMSESQRSDLLVSINDALTPILTEAIHPGDL
jgi:hypothetical protein